MLLIKIFVRSYTILLGSARMLKEISSGIETTKFERPPSDPLYCIMDHCNSWLKVIRINPESIESQPQNAELGR